MVLLGIDEHKYVRFSQHVAARFDRDIPLRGEFVIAAIYTRLNTGFNGHPKSSKSIPGSSINVETPADEIRRLVRSDQERTPAASPVFQLMYQMSYRSYQELIRNYRACAEGSQQWNTEKEKFIDYLVHIKDLWP